MDDNPTINNLTSSSNDLISCSTPRLLKQNSLDTDEGQSSDSANEGDDFETIMDDKHTRRYTTMRYEIVPIHDDTIR